MILQKSKRKYVRVLTRVHVRNQWDIYFLGVRGGGWEVAGWLKNADLPLAYQRTIDKKSRLSHAMLV